MADKNYTNKLGIDTSEFTKAIKEANANLKVLAQQVNKTRLNTVDYNTAVESLEKNITEHKNKLSALKQKYETLKDSLGENATATKKVEAEVEKEKNAVISAEQALKNYKVSLNNTSDSCKEACHALTQMEMVAYDLAKAFAKFATKALVDFTKETINTGMQFESAFAGVRKVVDGTEEDFKALETEIRQTALEKPISAEQLSSIYQMGSQLGIAKDGLKDFSNSIIDLAKTSNLTEEAGATMIAQYANVMKLPQEDYRRFASTLSYLGSTTATTESDIMELMSRLSGAGATIGLTHQDLLALATAMGSVGINAEAGGSAISTILSKISMDVDKNSDTLTTWANVAGMTVEQFKIAWKENTMSAIQAVISGLGDAKKGGESLNLILDDLGINNIRQLDTMRKLANASELLTEDMAKANKEWEAASFLGSSASQVYNTVESQLQLLKNTFAEMKISIYEGFKAPLAESMKELSNFLKSDDAKNFANEFSNVLKNVASIVISVIKTVISNFDKVIAVIKTAIKLIPMIVTQKVLSGLFNFVSAIQKAGGVMAMFNSIVLANPLTMFATVLAAVVVGIGTYCYKTLTATNVTKEYTKELEAQRNQLLANREERERNIAGIDAEAKHTQDLVNELKTLVDENGRVKEGCENRVNTLLSLIQNATGTEIQLIDGQIVKYKELIGTLDDVIAKKRLEAKINAYQGDYEKAIREEEEHGHEVMAINNKLRDAEAKLNKERLKDEQEIAKKKTELDKNGIRNSKFFAKSTRQNNIKALEQEIDELKKQKVLIDDNAKERKDIIKKYEGLVAEQYNNNNKTSNYNNVDTSNSSVAGTAVGTAYATSYSKAVESGAKTASKSIKEETRTTYQELLNQEKSYSEQLKNYLEEVKKGNSEVTVEMVQDTKNKLDEVQKKVKEMKDLLNGNVESVSLELEDENINHQSSKVIFGKGVLGDNAVEIAGAGKEAASAYLDAYLKEKGKQQSEIAISATKQANDEAINYQLATIEPNNLAIYDTTERMLAESKQTSQATGLTDNAYKVIDAETWTLNQAIEAAKQIDFAIIGRFMCEGIANGIRENAHMVISAVQAMMAEANSTAADEEEEHSPSKVFYRFGKFMDMGMANGIKDYAKLVSNQVREMTSRANEAINFANSQMKTERLGTQHAIRSTGPTEINYNFTQNNTSNKSLDTLAIYQESKSMLKRAIRNQYV